ncbi:extracellular solute-binding protein [Subtercola sp. PAMC28395]|uniref:ABC transporter substrate-binding protein n=1 Tax=Subtercola sp. PAMC28395 TaxID=2846775 RepID=UPI001C0AE9B1|nr:extracellular solute-binding protein [Subtercola sp. PAMC28395]QWT24165.1 extracellular solute-binding protein [Subtercola sp. PAMC28395]
MFRTTKVALVAAIGTASMLALSACSAGSPSATDAPVSSIKFVAAEYSDNTSAYWTDVAKRFTAKTGIKVDLQVIGWSDIHQQVSTMIQTNQIPDILNLDSFSQYAADDLLYPASDIETSALATNIPQNLATSGSYNGTQYALPFVGSASTLFYNTDLFAQAGISGPPTTLDELATDAKKISALPGKAGFALSLSPEAPHIDYSTFMFNMGGAYMKDGKWTVDSAENVTALQFLNKLTADGATEVNPGNTGRVDGTWQLFQSGTAGMVIGQSALDERMKGNGVKYATAPFPSASGVKPTSLAIADYIMGFKKPGNQDAVKQFLDFALAQENYAPLISDTGLLPVTTDLQAKLAADPTAGPYITALQSASFAPVGEPNWDKVLGEMKNSLGLAVSGKDPKDILSQIQAVATAN